MAEWNENFLFRLGGNVLFIGMMQHTFKERKKEKKLSPTLFRLKSTGLPFSCHLSPLKKMQDCIHCLIIFHLLYGCMQYCGRFNV